MLGPSACLRAMDYFETGVDYSWHLEGFMGSFIVRDIVDNFHTLWSYVTPRLGIRATHAYAKERRKVV